MHLNVFTITGFRSLSHVADIPVSAPTILAGHNDGGKSATLAALQFLTGGYSLTDDDRTYSRPDQATASDQVAPVRCTSTSVEGVFTTDTWEQSNLNLPEQVRLRRIAEEDSICRLEIWGPLPDDERLRDLAGYSAADLKALAKQLGITPPPPRRAEVEAALMAYAAEHSSADGWVSVPSGLDQRMPQIMLFGSAGPDEAVKVALNGRFKSHIADENLTGRLRDLEVEVIDKIRIDAKSLCDHVLARCPDLSDVFVEPDVSFRFGFNGAPLKISGASGGPVSLDRSGQGSSRRISLAIWEWTSELLQQRVDRVSAADPHDQMDESSAVDEEPPPVQIIVVYDEPDTHLDYSNQRKVMQLIREQSAIDNVSVIVATHSMNLIDGVDISDVVHLKLDCGRTTMERLGADTHDSLDIHLQQIAASLGLRNSVLLHERCFLAVEGDTEQQAIPILFRLSEGMSLQSAGIALWACSNNEGALHLASYLVRHGRSVMLMVDADSRNVSKGLFKEHRLAEFFGARAHEMVKFVGEPENYNEFEELFADQIWADVANTVWPKEGCWTAADFTALRTARKFSTQVQQMLHRESPSGPGGKPEMMYQLASHLDREAVPDQLREIFAELRALAD